LGPQIRLLPVPNFGVNNQHQPSATSQPNRPTVGTTSQRTNLTRRM
jgi:hypothetical protein